MKIFEIDCYEVTESDGGGRGNLHIAYVSTEALANTLVEKSGGWRAWKKYNKTISIFETMDEVNANTRAALRKKGLAKLTAAEKEALGLV